MARIFCDLYCQDSQALLDNNSVMDWILTEVEKRAVVKEMRQTLVPCQHLPDPGVSGIILGTGFHFTCHTFSRTGMVYVDLYTSGEIDSDLPGILRCAFHPKRIVNNMPTTQRTIMGKFGRHLAFTLPYVPFETMFEEMRRLLQVIDMHELAPIMTLQRDDGSYDILQPIVESHMAAHSDGKLVYIDVFSCKWFDDAQVLRLFNLATNIHVVPRGL